MAEVTESPGSIIRRCRDRKGLTLEELALDITSSVPHLSAIERDVRTPSEEIIEALAERLGLTEEELLTVYAGFGMLPPIFKQFVRNNIRKVVEVLQPFIVEK